MFGERRVAATPQTCTRIAKLGYEVLVESNAGEAASFVDAAYTEAGAKIVDAAAVWRDADIVLKVRAPDLAEIARMKDGTTLISFIWPAQNRELLEKLQAKKATVLAMDAVPRTTRAQRMDALSATANLAGYRAVIEAAAHFGRPLGAQTTAAGRIKPARVLVLGAGVAGLAAIAAARALGAVVTGFDTRPAVREQVQSLGATFLPFEWKNETGEGEGGYARQMSDAYLEAEQSFIAQHAKQSDIIVTTALVPGIPAPSSSPRARSSRCRTARSSSTSPPSRAATARSPSRGAPSRSSASTSSASPICRAAWRRRRASSTRRRCSALLELVTKDGKRPRSTTTTRCSAARSSCTRARSPGRRRSWRFARARRPPACRRGRTRP